MLGGMNVLQTPAPKQWVRGAFTATVTQEHSCSGMPSWRGRITVEENNYNNIVLLFQVGEPSAPVTVRVVISFCPWCGARLEEMNP